MEKKNTLKKNEDPVPSEKKNSAKSLFPIAFGYGLGLCGYSASGPNSRGDFTGAIATGYPNAGAAGY
jgi:hypothetical protein